MQNYNNFLEIFKLSGKITQAKKQLAEKDYIGRKIAEVLLTGTSTEIADIKKEYEAEIAEAKTLRKNINTWQEEIKKLRNEVKINTK